MASYRAKDKKSIGDSRKEDHTVNDSRMEGVEKQNGDKNSKRDATDCTQHWEDEEYHKNAQEEYRKFKEAQKESGNNADSDISGSAQGEDQGEDVAKKRGRGANQTTSNKKQKRGRLDEPRGAAGDKTRVPKKGQKVQWHSLPGYIDGTVVEVVYEEKNVEGKTVKGSKEDPRIVLKSSSSGKVAVHKPEAVYFD